MGIGSRHRRAPAPWWLHPDRPGGGHAPKASWSIQRSACTWPSEGRTSVYHPRRPLTALGSSWSRSARSRWSWWADRRSGSPAARRWRSRSATRIRGLATTSRSGRRCVRVPRNLPFDLKIGGRVALVCWGRAAARDATASGATW